MSEYPAYQYFNANPKDRKTGDCVVRAFALVIVKSWDEVLTDLCRIALEIKSVPDAPDCYYEYAKRLGLIERKVEVVNHRRPTVKSFTESHPHGTYILRLAHHLTAVTHGRYWDIWDCGTKSVYKYWEVPYFTRKVERGY